jgi:hypothetical protein
MDITGTVGDLQQIGRLNDPSAVRSLDWGWGRFTYVVDGTMVMLTDKFFPGIPREYWSGHPEAVDARGRVVMAAGGRSASRLPTSTPSPSRICPSTTPAGRS